MKKLIVTVMAGLALLLGQPKGAAAQEIWIKMHPGGSVVEEAIKVKRAIANGDTVRFLGRCDSACTMWLSVDGCIYPSARFGFHSAYHEDTKKRDPLANRFMRRFYPKWVARWVDAKGALNSTRLVYMDYAYASKFIPTCPL